MITPRRTRLVRVPDLHIFRSAIANLASLGDLFAIRSRLVVVPTRGAARQLRRTLEDAALARGARAVALPDLVTRDQLYDRFHARLANPPRRLGAFERDAIVQAAADAAAGEGPAPSFHVRPGLVVEILRFYDLLRRQSQQVTRFESLVEEALGAEADTDTGAERMLRQTSFLARVFREYERRVAEAGACDEHALRDRLLAEPAADPVRHVVVTMPDWIADPDGLTVADFDLLARVPGLESLDVVSTEALLGSGFHERLHQWWPGLDEVGPADLGVEPARVRPAIVTPASAPPEQTWFVRRDREEELVDIARQIKADRRGGEAARLDRTAVVFKRPLPYLYLAAGTLGSAGIPFQASDALPLAAEPAAAAVDLALELVESNFGRAAIVALLRSPQLAFDTVAREATSALDRELSEARYLGELSRLESLAEGWTAAEARPALDAALAAARALAPLGRPAPASQQIRRVLAFLESRLPARAGDDLFASRERRARAALADTLASLASAHAAHHDPDWRIDELAVAVRGAIESQTFVAAPPGSGVHLIDDQAARYGAFDDVTIVGLVENDWPERPRRNIFYPPALLKALGWPSEKDRQGAADARFLDLVASASRRVTLSTFTLDDESIVSPSSELDEVPRARLSTVARADGGAARVFAAEALSLDPVVPDVLAAADPAAAGWVALRTSRSAAESAEFHGAAGPQPPRAWSVSALETYLDCPFKFFAQHVLRLDEEPDDEEVMDPRRQGRFVHEVFEAFFSDWQSAGRRAITPDNLDEARERFAAVVDRSLAGLPATEASLERTRLLGSPAASGLGEAVLRMEAERPIAVVDRLLEHRLEGEFTVTTADGARRVALRGTADRIDLLEDGTFRLIDYKLGWPRDRARSLQLPIYGLCAEQRLAGRHGRDWTLGEVAYLVFKGPRRVVPLFPSPADRPRVMADAQARLVATLDAVARGEFPPTPDDVYRCETCTFASVCRKDYVGDV